MYIFAPGAGCTGKAKLVRPGDELIFCSTYDWDQREGPSMTFPSAMDEALLTSTCPPPVNHQPSHNFRLPLPDTTLMELSHKNFCAETKIKWVRKMYHDWRQFRHSAGFEFIPCDLEDKVTISHDSLKFALCRFITEVKKVNGEDFPGKMLYDIIVCVQFHLECLGFNYRLINDVAFRELKYTLDNMMKEDTVSGIGVAIRQVEGNLAHRTPINCLIPWSFA